MMFFAGSAQASVFSFVSGIFAKYADGETTYDSKVNSQTIALLEPTRSPSPHTGGGDVVIVDDTALEYQDEPDGDGYHSDQISLYTVRKGDTISQIAKMFGVTVNTIVWANDLEGRVISEGQTLVILPITGIKHVVKKGDTLPSIAKKYGGDLEEILQFNNLSKDAKLAVGDEIIIPDGELGTRNPSNPGSTSKPQSSQPLLAGYFQHPAPGARRTQGLHGRNGVDLGGLSIGSRILASAPGTVIVSKNSGHNGGYGKYAVISHPNGTQTLYAHLNQVTVTVGQRVDRGQLVGYLGNTGRSTGPHLHFEVRGARNPF